MVETVEDLRGILRRALELGMDVKKEINDILPEEEEEDINDNNNNNGDDNNNVTTSQLETSLRNFSARQPTIPLPTYKKGDNFARYCERFNEYITISELRSPNLFIYFLQNVDEETYAILKAISLNNAQKGNANLFCPLYKKAIYGDVTITLKNEVIDCKQSFNENITEYAFRLREKANLAYNNVDLAEENCFIAFLRGVVDPNLKRKINEATNLTTFNEAVKLAKRLEQINKMLEKDTESPATNEQIYLKETTEEFKPQRSSIRRNTSESPHYNEERRGNYRHRSPTTSTSRRRSPSPRNSRSIPTCWNCGKRGHISRKCWSNRESRGRNRTPEYQRYPHRQRNRSRTPEYQRNHDYRGRSRTPEGRNSSSFH